MGIPTGTLFTLSPGIVGLNHARCEPIIKQWGQLQDFVLSLCFLLVSFPAVDVGIWLVHLAE